MIAEKIRGFAPGGPTAPAAQAKAFPRFPADSGGRRGRAAPNEGAGARARAVDGRE
jgi:hypothetical protein